MAISSPPVTNINQRDQNATAQGGGSQTNPTAATVVASAVVNAAGNWEIVVYPFLSGTIAAGDLNNLGVYQGTVLKFTIPLPAVATTTQAVPAYTIVLSCANGDTVSVKAIANASGASAVYNAAIVARQVS